MGLYWGGHNITIRGIGSFNRQPGVSVSVDGVYQTKDSASQMYQLDLERIEIARGPQGTLYGRNSNGGVVNMITAAPTREREGDMSESVLRSSTKLPPKLYTAAPSAIE